MVSRFLTLSTGILLALVVAGPAAAQPSAPLAGEPEEAAPQPGTDAPPASPEEEAVRRQARLDALFARLASAETRDWQAVQEEIWRMWSLSGSPSMDLLLRRADEAVENGQPEIALRFLDDLVRLAPDFAEGWNKRATVYFMLDEYGRSVADIERVLALEPRHFGALSGLGIILERLGDKAGAFEAYSRALEVHPNLPGAREAVKRLRPQVMGREL